MLGAKVTLFDKGAPLEDYDPDIKVVQVGLSGPRGLVHSSLIPTRPKLYIILYKFYTGL